jgi:colanic acid/amylovoran biosynthesis protein
VKILITNIVTLNAGDAAILYGMIDILRAAFGDDTQFVVYDKYGEAPGRYYPEVVFRPFLYHTRRESPINAAKSRNRLLGAIDDKRFRLGLWAVKNGVSVFARTLLTNAERQTLLDYASADLIVSSGGTYLIEAYSLDERIFDYQVSLYLGKPLVFFTQSLGPFSNASNRRLLTPIFEKSILILVRDDQSCRHLSDLGVTNGNVQVAADAAFALSDLPAVEAAKDNSHKPGTALKVAISVREWSHFKTVAPAEGMKRYQEAMQVLTQHLVEKYNAAVTYISTCQGMPEYRTDDSKLATSIVEGLGDNVRRSVSVDSDFHHPAVLARKLKEYDLVIATRMHMAILALSVGTPVLPIAYEFKMQELFDRLGHGQWVQNIETVSGHGLAHGVDAMLNELPGIRAKLFNAVEKEHENAVASGQLVKQAFEEWRRSKSA